MYFLNDRFCTIMSQAGLWEPCMHNVQICPRLTVHLFSFLSVFMSSWEFQLILLSVTLTVRSLSVLPPSLFPSLAVSSHSMGGLELVCFWAGLFAYWGLFSPLVLKDLFTEMHYDAPHLQCWIRNGLFASWTLMCLIFRGLSYHHIFNYFIILSFFSVVHLYCTVIRFYTNIFHLLFLAIEMIKAVVYYCTIKTSM